MSITITETNSTGTTVYVLGETPSVGLAKVATTGSYNDLINKPTIPAAQKNSNWTSTAGVTAILNKPNFATVATSGNYNDLNGKPTIPVLPTLATVATSGNYSDLNGKPTIPAAQVNVSWTATTGVSAILNKPNLATVATSGDYNDLSNKPTLTGGSVDIPLYRKTNSYTLVLSDKGAQIDMNTASPCTVTIPTNASVPFDDKTQIMISQYGTGQVTIVGQAGVVIRSSGGKTKLFDQYSAATIKKIGTNEWLLIGNLK